MRKYKNIFLALFVGSMLFLGGMHTALATCNTTDDDEGTKYPQTETFVGAVFVAPVYLNDNHSIKIFGSKTIRNCDGDTLPNSGMFLVKQHSSAQAGDLRFIVKLKNSSGVIKPNNGWAISGGDATVVGDTNNKYRMHSASDTDYPFYGNINFTDSNLVGQNLYLWVKLQKYFDPTGSEPLGWYSVDVVTIPITIQASAPTASLSADAYTIPYGGSTTLHWTTSNAVNEAWIEGLSGSFSAVSGATSTGSLTSQTKFRFKAYSASGSSVDSNEVTINIASGNPSCTIGANPTSGNTPLSVDFSGAGSGGSGAYSSYTWNFGDGTAQQTGSSLSHSYSTAGSFTATLTVKDSNNNTGSCTKVITVNQASGPSCTIGASPTSGSAPLAVSFSGTASGGSGTYSSFTWNFGDNATATGAFSSHTYSTANSYTATLTVKDSNNNTGSCTKVITVNQASGPTCTISANPVSGNAPLLVSFSGAGSGGSGTYSSYTWDFGDNTTGLGQQTSHTYSSAKNYSSKLTITDSAGNSGVCSKTIVVTQPTLVITPYSSTITVGNNATLTAKYDPDGPSGSQGEQSVSGSAVWTANNSSIASSNGGGIFVGLAVGSTGVSAAYAGLTATAVINVNAAQGTPDFSISASPGTQSVTAGGTTSYTITVTSINNFSGTVSLVTPTTRQGVTFSISPNSVTVSGNGSKTATLSAKTTTSTTEGISTVHINGSSGGTTHETQVDLNVTKAPVPNLSCTYSINPQSGSAPLAVGFSAQATGGSGGNTYAFSYGDGESLGYQQSSSASHEYQNDGTYQTHVEVKDSSGTVTSCVAPISFVNVAGPQCDFTANPSAIVRGATATLLWHCYNMPTSTPQSCQLTSSVGGLNLTVPFIDGRRVKPSQTTIYTLTCPTNIVLHATVNVGFLPILREIIPRF